MDNFSNFVQHIYDIPLEKEDDCEEDDFENQSEKDKPREKDDIPDGKYSVKQVEKSRKLSKF